MSDLKQAIINLTDIFGPANAQGYGSGVWQGTLVAGDSLAHAALQVYIRFLGAAWNSERQADWQAGWKHVADVPAGVQIINFLKQQTDQAVKAALSLLLEATEDAAGSDAIAAVFDHAALQQQSIFLMGDTDAYSGLLIIGMDDARNYVALGALMD